MTTMHFDMHLSSETEDVLMFTYNNTTCGMLMAVDSYYYDDTNLSIDI